MIKIVNVGSYFRRHRFVSKMAGSSLPSSSVHSSPFFLSFTPFPFPHPFNSPPLFTHLIPSLFFLLFSSPPIKPVRGLGSAVSSPAWSGWVGVPTGHVFCVFRLRDIAADDYTFPISWREKRLKLRHISRYAHNKFLHLGKIGMVLQYGWPTQWAWKVVGSGPLNRTESMPLAISSHFITASFWCFIRLTLLFDFESRHQQRLLTLLIG